MKTMNVFESLIDELKRENLLEEGIELGQEKTEENKNDSEVLTKQDKNSPESQLVSSPDFALTGELSDEPDVREETDFYRRSAMEEVSSLQMVEHIFSGVEREQLKKIPKSYDSIPVSTALHDFLQVSKNGNNPENSAAEFKLMQETESWYTTLSYRDKNILSAQLRRYCETAKPALSAQALASLARFYRNAPYSETGRSKFDMVITRLFSVEKGDEREAAFNRREIVQHLSELYADWSSVALYDTEDDAEISETVQNFEKFIAEAETFEGFEKLVASNFFNRLRTYKEQTGVNFYAPQIAAIVIECNIRVGNVYVRLLNEERDQTNSDILENKYGYLLDQTISEAASKTLQLTTLLEEKNAYQEVGEQADEEVFEFEEDDSVASEADLLDEEKQLEPVSPKSLQINKILIAAVITIVLLIAGFYFFRGNSVVTDINSETGKEIQLEAYYFKDYLKSAKIKDNSLNCVVNSNWNKISPEKKREVLKNILAVGKEKGYGSVHLQTDSGKTVDYISNDSIIDGNLNGN